MAAPLSLHEAGLFFRPSHRLQDGWLFTPAAGAGWAATVQVRIVDYEFGITSLLNKKKLLQEGNVREVDNTHIQLAGDVDVQTRSYFCIVCNIKM